MLKFLSRYKRNNECLTHYYGPGKHFKVPLGIKIIEKHAFSGNEGIETIELPDSLVIIEQGAFWGCRNLKSINFPQNLIHIGEFAFYATGLKSIALPESLQSVGVCAFSAIDVESVTIPSNIKCIPESMFDLCWCLKTVDICDGVQMMGESAFGFCPELREIRIPDSLSLIYKEVDEFPAFSGTDGIKNVIASDKWKKEHRDIYLTMIPSENETENFIMEGDTLVRYVGRRAEPQILPNVRKIGKRAFFANSHIEKIRIPYGVHTICRSAFSSCKNLTVIELPDSLRTIEEDAFAGTGIVNLSIPDSVLYVERNIVSSCKSLKEFVFPESLIEALEGVFNYMRVFPKDDDFYDEDD